VKPRTLQGDRLEPARDHRSARYGAANIADGWLMICARLSTGPFGVKGATVAG